MSDDVGNLPHRNVILIVETGAVVNGLQRVAVNTIAVAALIQQPVGKIQILLLSGFAVELHQGQFYLFVPGNPVALAGAHYGHCVVHHTLRHVQKRTLAGCVIIGDGSLYHMACAVELMFVHVGPALDGAGQGEEGVDVTVGLLGARNLGNPLVALGLQFRVGMLYERVGQTFKGLVYI